jgi:diguanylate cyclase (GGDEF)-like protein
MEAGAAAQWRLDLLPQTVCEALDLWSADIWEVSREGDALLCVGFWSRDDAEERRCVGTSVPLAQSGDLRRLVLAGEVMERHADEPRLSAADAAALRAQGLQSRIDQPLVLGDQVVGVLSLGERRVRRLTAPERELLRHLGAAAALALHADIRARRAEEDAGHLQDLVRSGQAMAESRRVQATIAQAKTQAVDLLRGIPCEVEVALLRDDGSLAHLAPGGGDGAQSGGVWEPWPADALVRQAVKLRRREQERSRDGSTRSITPLLHHDRCLGVLDVRAALPRGLRREEAGLLLLLAGQVAAALAGARARRSMEERSATDSLTGLYGRWFFYERLAEEVARARRYNQPLSVLVAQVDDPGGVVASGRPAGERVLRAMAQIIKGCLRDKVDVPCRHGMASFAVLLPSTPPGPGGAGLVAERLREVAAQTEVGDDDLGVLGRFTLSVGVAGFPQHCEDADELAAVAEEALRSARRRGGDLVVLAGE